MRKLLEYLIRDNKTDYSAKTFNTIFGDIDGRLHTLEQLKISWDQAIKEVQSFGLARINAVLQPILDAAYVELQALKDEKVAIRAEFDSEVVATFETDILAVWQTILDEWNNTILDRILDLEATADDHTPRLDAAEADLTSHAGRLDAAESDIATLQAAKWQRVADWDEVDGQKPLDGNTFEGDKVQAVTWICTQLAAGDLYRLTVLPTTTDAGTATFYLQWRDISPGQEPGAWSATETISLVLTASTTQPIQAVASGSFDYSALGVGGQVEVKLYRDNDGAAPVVVRAAEGQDQLGGA